MKPTIIFIHGMFLNPKSWAPWIRHFKALGYECKAPAWPHHEGEPSALRQEIPANLGNLGLATVYQHYVQLLRKDPVPAIVIGHSLGGLVMQKLVAAGLVQAGVGICPVAPNGMLAADWGFLRNTTAITNPFAGNEPFEMTPESFHRNFANPMTEEESNAAYESYAVHESRQVLRDVKGKDGRLDPTLPHAPMLFIGAELDEIIPPGLVTRNAQAYTDKRSHSEYVEFSGRGHFICGQPGWEEVALRVENWLEAHLLATRA